MNGSETLSTTADLARAPQIDALAKAGATLYGPRWQSDLARDLEVSGRTIRRWATGAEPMGERHWQRLIDLLDQRAVDCAALARDLSAWH